MSRFSQLLLTLMAGVYIFPVVKGEQDWVLSPVNYTVAGGCIYVTYIVFFITYQVKYGNEPYNTNIGYDSLKIYTRSVTWIPLLSYAMSGVTYWFRWFEQYSFFLFNISITFPKEHIASKRQGKVLKTIYWTYVLLSLIFLGIAMANKQDASIDIADYYRAFMVAKYFFTSFLIILTTFLFLHKLK